MHKEYTRIAENPTVGILVIHGIISSPNHFRDLLGLIPDRFSVHALLLDGHGKTAKDFSNASMKRWEEQVSHAVEELSRNHREIYILAHSLGTLLSAEQATRNEKITGMFWLDSPLRVFVRPVMVPISLRFSLGTVDRTDPLLDSFAQSYSIAPDRNLFHYIGWIPRFLELLSKSRKTRKLIPKINCPTMVFQSGKDELVSMRSCKYFRENPNITLQILPHCGHTYYPPEDLALLKTAFADFLSDKS